MKNYKHNPKLATVIVTEESGTLIQMPNGDILPGTIFTRVDDKLDAPTTVLIKILCNIQPTK